MPKFIGFSLLSQIVKSIAAPVLWGDGFDLSIDGNDTNFLVYSNNASPFKLVFFSNSLVFRLFEITT